MTKSENKRIQSRKKLQILKTLLDEGAFPPPIRQCEHSRLMVLSSIFVLAFLLSPYALAVYHIFIY